MEVKVQKWGNSNGIRIPKEMLDELNIKTDDILSMIKEDNKIIIKKLPKKQSLKEMFDDHDGDYKSIEFDWGEPVGREIW